MNKITQTFFTSFKGCVLIWTLLLSSSTILSKSCVKTTERMDDPIVTTSIPDPVFEQALINLGYDDVVDGYVITDNIDNVTELDVSGLGISSLAGIEGFTNLLDLYCTYNLLTSLDVSMLTNLRFLDCRNNLLTNLNITGLTNLESLICWVNNLTTLDVTASTNLHYLDCEENSFTSINVTGLNFLYDFYCKDNQLTTLDLRGVTGLTYFESSNNPSLDYIFVDDVTAATNAGNWIKDNTAIYCGITIWNGSWSNNEPTSTTVAIITDFYNEPANIDAYNLTISNNTSAIIPSGFNVTLNASLTVESGSSFTLSNNANLIQSTEAANSGDITVNRDSNLLKRLDYTIWSSPVTGTQRLYDFSPMTSTNRFNVYNPNTDAYDVINNTVYFGKGKGYLIRMPNSDATVGYNAGTTAITHNGVFTGTPNNGTVTVTGLVAAKYNAIGNPYPSTIDADAFINNGETDGTLYFFRKTNGGSGSSYATYTLAGETFTDTSATPNGTIQVGQGFLVTPIATTLSFTNTMRVANNDNQFFKTKKTIEKNRIWLNLTDSAGAFSQTLVSYMTNATQGVDVGIDGKYINDSKIALTSNINNVEYTIQGRPLPFDPSDVVPLNFKTDKAGNYTIAIDHKDGFFAAGQDVYLVDSLTGTETDLKAGSYTFTAPAGTANSRFSLKYQKTLGVDTPAFNENSVTVYKTKGIVYVNSGNATIANVKVYDVQGKLLVELKKVESTTATISNLKDTNQVLIVKVTSGDNAVVSKKILN